MSVIAARVEQDKICVSADSILTKEDLKRTNNFFKLIEHDGMIVGGCGYAEELSLFLEFTKRELPKECSIKGIHDYMLQFSINKEAYTKDANIENSYIIAFNGRLFEVEGMFVQEILDYTAIGQGEPYALAALYLGCSAEKAVEVASRLCCFVSEPIISYTITR